MRREQIFKICLNFFLDNEVELKRKDDNSWTFAANDFSEGEFEPTSFAIRFKNQEIAQGFKKAIEDALARAAGRPIRWALPLRLVFFLAKIGDLLNMLRLPFPLNSDKLSKMTSTLTFDDSLARKMLGWRPKPAI